MVSLNHRLNILGFLDVSAYGEKYANSGNVGMADIVMALEWIRDNIADFGGDPDNKIGLLLSFAGEKRSVADPWYTGNFEKTYNDILLGCKALYQSI